MSLKSSKSVVNSAIKKILPVRLKSNGTLFFFDRQFATLLPDLVLIERYIFNSFFILCSLIVCSVSLREVYFSSIVYSVSEQGSAPAGARPLGTPANQLSPTARLLGVFRRPQALNTHYEIFLICTHSKFQKFPHEITSCSSRL